MEMRITGFGDKGKIKAERIGLKAIKACELKFFMLFRTEFTDRGSFYNKSNNAFWFPPKNINAGDKVIIYSKSGENSMKVNDDGTVTYFFYWGLSKPIFVNEKDGVVLVEISSWETSRDK